ncbi:hypothetical protein WN51_03628 [Melipona quadrifasciata]|uniref:Uncharacterized protein n=1 Tax=Melipona quadrifasciata TaxID=166423 RepID=A0A0M8ZU96_9HYME|nr:hypothetical protein WN51_03628 [Melipona quadrifasciata]
MTGPSSSPSMEQARSQSRRHDQAVHAEGLTRRGPPSNTLRITDRLDALESVLL